MESQGLKDFLKVAGDAVHSINTICVGLCAVAEGSAKKPQNLSVGWSTSDPTTAASKARVFALRASLVFVEEALLAYFEFLKHCSYDNKKFTNALNTTGAASRVREVFAFLQGVEPYWEPMVVLLVRWRNQVVHNTSKNLSSHYRSVLAKNASQISKNHAGIDVSRTLDNFDSGQITLKDFTTLIAITIRFVRAIDQQMEPDIRTLEGFYKRLESRSLVDTFNRIMGSNGEATRTRKLQAFLDSEFSPPNDALKQEIYSAGRYVPASA